MDIGRLWLKPITDSQVTPQGTCSKGQPGGQLRGSAGGGRAVVILNMNQAPWVPSTGCKIERGCQL